MTDQSLFVLISVLSILTLAAFYLSYSRDRTNLANGLLFNLFVLSLSVAMVVGSVVFQGTWASLPFRLVTLVVFFVYGFVLIFGMAILIAGSFINARIVSKREKRHLANLLTLFLGIGLTIYLIISNLSIIQATPVLKYLLAYGTMILIFAGLSFYNFLLNSAFYGLFKQKPDKDYIIVLGSGLVDGSKVSNLLAGRIDKAIEYYELQKVVGKNSKLIFSGGQGPGEEIPEAEAMFLYALERGVPEEDLLQERESKTTLENFRFSKKIMDQDSNGEKYNAIFATSNYHVFRAALLAKEAGLKTTGIGSKTAMYFLPNAVLREYIAIVSMKKKSYLIKLLILTQLFVGGLLINIFS